MAIKPSGKTLNINYKMNLDEASLYIHIPFCADKKCDYCDFYSVPVKRLDPCISLFIDNLIRQGDKLFEKYKPKSIPTVYIGGGTPSVLCHTETSRLLKWLNGIISKFSSSVPAEVTIEANPESLNDDFLAAIREGGVTRLSLGIQTFHDPSRSAIGRIGDGISLYKKLALAAAYYPESFSADLMCGLPFQNKKNLHDDISDLISFKPAHISFYALTLAPESALRIISEKGEYADELWISGRDALESAAYRQYEVSNFCLTGKESLHNIRYWRMKSWLALGPGASGTIIQKDRAYRYTFPQELSDWNVPHTEELDEKTLIKDTFLMGFRYIEGPDEELFRQRFNKSINKLIPKTLKEWRSRSLMQSDKCALTKEGLLLLDQFLINAFEELDA